jgi:hypothetical protein
MCIGRDISSWEKNVDWETVDPDGAEVTEDDNPGGAIGSAGLNAATVEDREEMGRVDASICSYSVGSDYRRLQRDLTTNFSIMYEQGQVKWPKGLSKASKGRMPNRPQAVRRAANEYMARLYVAPSTMRRQESDGSWDALIGRGLFSELEYGRNQTICQFEGDIIDSDTYDVLRAEHGQKRVAFAHPLSEDRAYYLDCFNYLTTCKASFANSPYRCMKHGTPLFAAANCFVEISQNRGKMTLKCLVDRIPANTELLWEYEDSYEYPDHYDY